MYIPIIKNSPKPAYQQITEGVRKQILTGELKPAEELPSIRQLAQDIQVSVITIRRAYGDLEREGLIYSRPGLGSYVADLAKGELNRLKIELLKPVLEEVACLAKEIELESEQVLFMLADMLKDCSKGEAGNHMNKPDFEGSEDNE